MQGLIFSIAKTTFHIGKLEDASLVPWTLKGLKDMNPGRPPVHHYFTIHHPIGVLAKLILDIPVPLGRGVVILDRILDSELEDLKKCFSCYSL